MDFQRDLPGVVLEEEIGGRFRVGRRYRREAMLLPFVV